MDQLKFHKERLRASGLRPTNQRLVICKVLFDRKETFHFTIEKLKQTVEKNSKKKIKYLKKFIYNSENLALNDNLIAGIITPDKDIVADSKLLEPAYLVFSNYELILKWNRSLRFALAVCTLTVYTWLLSKSGKNYSL